MTLDHLQPLATSTTGIAVLETANIALPSAGIDNGAIVKIVIEVIIGVITLFKLLKRTK